MTSSQENVPDLWINDFPRPRIETHKYNRGTALVRGGSLMTGAARLAARAAQRMGAGLVTVAAASSAFAIYEAAFESIIVRPCDTVSQWKALIDNDHMPALLIGPGLGLGGQAKEDVLAALGAERPMVLDADGITAFADDPELLFKSLHEQCVLTPHRGEFCRLFGDQDMTDKLRQTINAAQKAGAVVLLKGAETTIAAPDGQAVINRNAPAWLATAGSGDVLAGMITGLLAQGMPAFWAAAAAAWLHGRSASLFGPGLIAEDIVDGIPAVLRENIEGKADF